MRSHTTKQTHRTSVIEVSDRAAEKRKQHRLAERPRKVERYADVRDDRFDDQRRKLALESASRLAQEFLAHVHRDVRHAQGLRSHGGEEDARLRSAAGPELDERSRARDALDL